MDNCQYCGYGGGKHGDGCPESMSGGEQELARLAWKEGYRNGRDGGNKPDGSSPTYILGYFEGVLALGEAENWFDSRESDDAQPGDSNDDSDEPLFSADDLEDLDKRLDDLDDPDTIRRTT